VVGDIPTQTAPPTSTNLNAWLSSFYTAEDKRQTKFPDALPADAQPFELLVINICSLLGRRGCRRFDVSSAVVTFRYSV
jgi:hypothetical protein